MLKSNIIIHLILISLAFTACQQNAQAPREVKKLLTAHKWQLSHEEGLNLPVESLGDNIIELTPKGDLIYYENQNEINLFSQNTWMLSPDQKKLIEVFPDGSKVQCEIVALSSKELKLRYLEPNGLGGKTTVVETYVKFEPKIVQLVSAPK